MGEKRINAISEKDSNPLRQICIMKLSMASFLEGA